MDALLFILVTGILAFVLGFTVMYLFVRPRHL